MIIIDLYCKSSPSLFPWQSCGNMKIIMKIQHMICWQSLPLSYSVHWSSGKEFLLYVTRRIPWLFIYSLFSEHIEVLSLRIRERLQFNLLQYNLLLLFPLLFNRQTFLLSLYKRIINYDFYCNVNLVLFWKWMFVEYSIRTNKKRLIN